MKLLEVLIKKKDNLHLEIYSNDLKIEKDKSIPKWYLSYDELSIIEVKDDAKVDYKVTGSNWVGKQFDKDDAFSSILLEIFRNSLDVEVLFIHPTIQTFINNYKEVVCVSDNREILKTIINEVNWKLDEYKLEFATNFFAYYSNVDGEMIMIRVQDGSIATNMEFFAIQGIISSIKDIKKGEEKLLYGSYKEYEEVYKDCLED